MRLLFVVVLAALAPTAKAQAQVRRGPRLLTVVLARPFRFGARGVGADPPTANEQPSGTPPADADAPNGDDGAVTPPVVARRASTPISPEKRDEMAKLAVLLSTEWRGELEQVRAECFAAVHALDRRETRDMARKMRILTVGLATTSPEL